MLNEKHVIQKGILTRHPPLPGGISPSQGKDVVLMFVTDEVRATAPEVKMLKGFHKTPLLAPGEHTI
eukprot:1186512-Prorocentrum_minimum.AAC.1